MRLKGGPPPWGGGGGGGGWVEFKPAYIQVRISSGRKTSEERELDITLAAFTFLYLRTL